MSLSISGWWTEIPSDPGWYLIETNTPLSVLEELPSPSLGGRLYDIPERLIFNNFLKTAGLAILPNGNDTEYIVYSGEHGNLKSRAREHTHVHKKTGCLCLSQYPQLFEYKWNFLYLTCDALISDSNGDKALRAFIEQKWRGKFGWPLLCKK